MKFVAPGFIPYIFFLLFKTFYFVLMYSQLPSNVVVVSSEQQRDSAIHIHVSILPKTSLPSRLPHNTELSSMLYNRSLLVIHFKYSSVSMSIPNSLTIPSPRASCIPSLFIPLAPSEAVQSGFMVIYETQRGGLTCPSSHSW